jgi:hypothetical protein
MLSSIALFLATRIGRYAFAGGVFVALFVGYTMQQRRIGAEKAIAGIEKATDDAIGKAHRAGSKSRSGTGGLQLNFRD